MTDQPAIAVRPRSIFSNILKKYSPQIYQAVRDAYRVPTGTPVDGNTRPVTGEPSHPNVRSNELRNKLAKATYAAVFNSKAYDFYGNNHYSMFLNAMKNTIDHLQAKMDSFGKLVSEGESEIIDPRKITLSDSLVENHPLSNIIRKQTPLSEYDFYSLFRSGFINLTIPIYNKSGVCVASGGDTHQAAWTRDMAAIALGKLGLDDKASAGLEYGDIETAARIGIALYKAYSSKAQRDRINKFLDPSETPVELWEPRLGNANYTVPHTKFNIDGEGKLRDCSQPWGMQQLDAYGYFLTLIAKLIDSGKTDLFDIEKLDANARAGYARAADAPQGELVTESTLVAMVRFLHKLKYWEVRDNGAWEDKMQKQRASSIAAVVSGLQLIQNYFKKQGYFANLDKDPVISCNDGNGYNVRQFKADLDEAITKGREFLNKERFLADEAREIDVDETNERHIDAALLFPLVLSDPDAIGLSQDQRKAILKTVYKLIGEVGFKRFKKDHYEGEGWVDYAVDKKEFLDEAKERPNPKFNPSGEFSDPERVSADDFEPAQWSMFDPYLAVVNYRMFIDSNGEDIESYLRADKHVRRALAQVTKGETEYDRPNMADDEAKKKITIKVGEALESMWLDRKTRKWMPGENQGLNWTKIALQQMLVKGTQAARLFRDKYPNNDRLLNNIPALAI